MEKLEGFGGCFLNNGRFHSVAIGELGTYFPTGNLRMIKPDATRRENDFNLDTYIYDGEVECIEA